MIRPSNQAKLVFLGLLRTVSALAGTTESRLASQASYSFSSLAVDHSNHQQQHNHHPNQLTLRLARRTDVPSIQRCNLATLPENYNSAFYVHHLRQWPELSLVVVENEPESPEDDSRACSLPFVSAFSRNNHNNNKPPNVVAYVLGKVEEEQVQVTDDLWPGRTLQTQQYGHVTSLAVLPQHRRQGLAQQLMEQLHAQLETHYPRAGRVGLHVRQSNHAATTLYQRFGYDRAQQIPNYYQDGEDGYYMVKALARGQQQQHQVFSSYQPGLFASWRQPPPPQQQQQQHQPPPSWLQLPRPVGRGEMLPAVVDTDSDSDDEPELLSGSI